MGISCIWRCGAFSTRSCDDGVDSPWMALDLPLALVPCLVDAWTGSDCDGVERLLGPGLESGRPARPSSPRTAYMEYRVLPTDDAAPRRGRINKRLLQRRSIGSPSRGESLKGINADLYRYLRLVEHQPVNIARQWGKVGRSAESLTPVVLLGLLMTLYLLFKSEAADWTMVVLTGG